MGTAYAVSADDVGNVLASNPRMPGFAQEAIEALAEKCLGQLDLDVIEASALWGDSLDEQTDYANDEIARQLRVLGVLMQQE